MAHNRIFGAMATIAKMGIALVVLGATTVGTAQARDVRWSVVVGENYPEPPPRQVYYSNPTGYYVPPPPPKPVYYYAPPGYDPPPSVNYYRDGGHYRPHRVQHNHHPHYNRHHNDHGRYWEGR